MSNSSRSALIGTIIGSALGFIFPFALTASFEAGPLTDTYLFAYGFAIFGSTILAGVMEANFLPLITGRLSAGTHAVRRYVVRTALQTVLFAALICAVVFVVAYLMVQSQGDWTAQQRNISIACIGIFAVFVACAGVNGVLSASLYSLGDFFSPTGSTALRALAPMLALPILAPSYGAVIVLAALVSLGEAARTAVLAARFVQRSRGLEGTKTFGETPPLWINTLPHMLNMAVLTTSPIVDRAFAARLDEGAITVLDLGAKLLFVPITGFMAVLVLVSATRWAKLLRDEPGGLATDFWRTIRKSVYLTVLAGGLMMAGLVGLAVVTPGDRIAGVDEASLIGIAGCLMLGLPAAVISGLGGRLMTTTRQTKYMPAMAVLAVTVNGVGDYIGSMTIGVYGIAMATTVTRYSAASFSLYICWRILRRQAAASSPANDDGPAPPEPEPAREPEPSSPAPGRELESGRR